MKEFITIKTTKEAQRLIRQIAANSGERQYEVLERLLKQELEKCTQKEA